MSSYHSALLDSILNPCNIVDQGFLNSFCVNPFIDSKTKLAPLRQTELSE